MQCSKEGALLNRGGSESLHRLFLEAFGTQGNPIWKNEHHPCEGFDSRMLQTVSIFPSHPLTVPKTAMMQGGLPRLSHQEGNTASPLEKNMSEEEEEYVPETWEILAGVVCAETYEEFDRAYSLLKRGKKAPKKSSVDLWKVLSGEYKELNEGRRKKWEEKKKLEKLQQQEKKE